MPVVDNVGSQSQRCQDAVQRARYRLSGQGVTQLPRYQLNCLNRDVDARFMRRTAVLCANLFYDQIIYLKMSVRYGPDFQWQPS